MKKLQGIECSEQVTVSSNAYTICDAWNAPLIL